MVFDNKNYIQGNSFLIRGQVWSSWGRQNMNQTLLQLLLRMNLNKDGIPYQGRQLFYKYHVQILKGDRRQKLH